MYLASSQVHSNINCTSGIQIVHEGILVFIEVRLIRGKKIGLEYHCNTNSEKVIDLGNDCQWLLTTKRDMTITHFVSPDKCSPLKYSYPQIKPDEDSKFSY